MKIALDLDGVLADLHRSMIQHGEYEYADFTTWDKPDIDTFMRDAAYVWDHHWNDIDPVENNLHIKTAQLSLYHDVDIVTRTAADDTHAMAWLKKHDIVYDEFVRPPDGESKDVLQYDAYIDDKPAMAGTVPTLFLRDRLWNQSVRGDGNYFYHSYEPSYIKSDGVPDNQWSDSKPWVIRVTGLTDVIHNIHMHEF